MPPTHRPSRARRPSRRRPLALLLAGLLGATLLTALSSTAAVSAGDPCGAGGNAISCENSKPGSPRDEWDVTGPGASDIQGFSTDISVNVGSRVDFKIDTSASAYTIGIYRFGWYGGDGARKVATVTPSAALPQRQPQCITDTATELYDCGNWAVSASWNVPSTAVSGVYQALLTRTDNGDQSVIVFVVRNDASTSSVLFQTSDPTWQAYNTYGGSDFYQGAANGRAYKISYNRPVLTRGGPGGRDMFFSNEMPAVAFLERNGYDVSYQAGVDTDRFGSRLTQHKVFLSVGHDEYVSKGQRANIQAARDAGVNLAFLGGNDVYWKTRYEPSADASHTDYRTLVSYKETWSNAKIDPSAEWTGTWRDPRFAPKSAGANVPENNLIGTMYMSNNTDLPLTVPAAQGKTRLWRNTSLATQAPGTSTALAPHTIGYESNEDVDNGARPPGLIKLSTTTGATPQYLRDYGSTVTPGTTTHSLTLYKAASGALVFSAGSIQWTWGLDDQHDSDFGYVAADSRMQQSFVNLLADMSAQPTTLMTGLSAATKSTDTTAPTTTITSPASGATTPNGSNVTVTGTAADTGGGIVAGVEASTDGGTTWHAATGTTSWSYSYVQKGAGSTPIQVRAIDDSANIGGPATRSFAVTCPCSVYGVTVPGTPASDDASATEVGMRFTPSTSGFVTGVRFYKGAGNSGTHVGSLWSPTGARLAQVTFTGESATGWQTAAFSTPVAVNGGTAYVVSYTAPAGRYAADANAFSARGIDADPLQVAGGYGAAPAGLWGNPGTYPAQTYQNSSYYVDVTFTQTDTSPLVATGQAPVDGATNVPVDTVVQATYSKPLTSGSQGLVLKDSNNATVPGSTTYDAATRTITFRPTSALAGFVAYTATLSGTDTLGNPVTTGKTWTFTTGKPPNAPGVCPCSLFADTTTPSVLEVDDPAAVTLGVRFTSDTGGVVDAVRFYKGPNNTGSHVGTLWSDSGQVLARGTFTGESTSGWQTLTFASPVAITAGTPYVATYRTTVGRYSATPNAFAASDLSRPPLRVTSSAGVYSYADAFPTATSATSYLVDVVFDSTPPPVALASTDPPGGAVNVPRGTTISATTTTPVNPSGWTMAVTAQPSGTAIAGSATLDDAGTTITFRPSATLPADSDVRVQLSGVTSIYGATLATQTWTFHTKPADAPTTQSLFSDQVPTTASVDDGAAVEVGTAFSPTTDGTVTALRFYKGTGNNGTHVGSLWSSSGTRLATVTFTNETATGWQQAALSTPVAVSAGSTYVVSYLAPQGHYSATGGFFDDPWSAYSLTAPSDNNGRYLYGASGGFPTFSYNATNYFADVVFAPTSTTPAISVTGRTPVAGATGVATTTAPTITFSSAIASGYQVAVTSGTTTVTGTTTLSTDGRTLTFTPSSSGLPADADVQVAVSGVTGTNGATLATERWTFHTAPAAGTTTLSSLFPTQTPATAATTDTAAVELGTAFTPSRAGKVTAIKFWKGSTNTGTHTGSIWSSTGTRLATVTFRNETASGWQTANLTTPLTLTAGSTYVVSYFAPRGRYAVTPNFFTAPVTSGPLTAPSTNNGRYVYGASGGFPNSTYNATNYFVDLVYSWTS